jgi:hypothetical protein
VGHGSLNTLASEGILRIDDLQNLTNVERPTVVTAATCLTSYFSYPGYDSIGERLLRGSGGGAAAVWSASGMSQNEHAVRMLSTFHSTARGNAGLRIGDVIREAMRLYEKENRPRYLIETYELLGDPAMELK